jgi:hypothetical protein
MVVTARKSDAQDDDDLGGMRMVACEPRTSASPHERAEA